MTELYHSLVTLVWMSRRFAILLAGLAAACGSPGEEKQPERSARMKAHYEKAVKERRILLGMREDEVKKVFGGKPERTKRVKRGQYTRVVWHYPGAAVYFDDLGYVVDYEGP